jgi:hypothetical protein
MKTTFGIVGIENTSITLFLEERPDLQGPKLVSNNLKVAKEKLASQGAEGVVLFPKN